MQIRNVLFILDESMSEKSINKDHYFAPINQLF